MFISSKRFLLFWNVRLLKALVFHWIISKKNRRMLCYDIIEWCRMISFLLHIELSVCGPSSCTYPGSGSQDVGWFETWPLRQAPPRSPSHPPMILVQSKHNTSPNIGHWRIWYRIKHYLIHCASTCVRLHRDGKVSFKQWRSVWCIGICKRWEDKLRLQWSVYCSSLLQAFIEFC